MAKCPSCRREVMEISEKVKQEVRRVLAEICGVKIYVWAALPKKGLEELDEYKRYICHLTCGTPLEEDLRDA